MNFAFFLCVSLWSVAGCSAFSSFSARSSVPKSPSSSSRGSMAMARFLVTGANKGIGLAIVKGLLQADKHNFVFLGCRDMGRGLDAVKGLIDDDADFKGRVEALKIDVSDAESVTQAAASVRGRFADDNSGPCPLTALINNAGVMTVEASAENFARCVEVNVRGVMRTTEAFLPLLDADKGRIVIISSAAGPSFVNGCSAERQKLMTDPSVTLSQITGVMDECLAISSASPAEEVSAKFSDAGLAGADTRAGYGFTKAVVNMYNMYLAREHPNLLINSCTPGWIVTDLSRAFVGAGSGKTVEEMGGKPPSDGAKTPIFLATGDVPGSGWYFGSDGLRSPLDRYRNPGDPAYDGK